MDNQEDAKDPDIKQVKKAKNLGSNRNQNHSNLYKHDSKSESLGAIDNKDTSSEFIQKWMERENITQTNIENSD